MRRSRSIPEELIKVKAHKIWEKRLLKGRDGTPESDWEKARQYLEKHRWEVFWWKFRKRCRYKERRRHKVIQRTKVKQKADFE